MTYIERPDGKEQKQFSFDFSYWSHDGFTSRDDGFLIPANRSSSYVDQVCFISIRLVLDSYTSKFSS